MNSHPWTVRAVRTLHGRETAVYELGPYRFKLFARAVAWLETTDGPVWQQSCEIMEAVPADGRAMHAGHQPWMRASA